VTLFSNLKSWVCLSPISFLVFALFLHRTMTKLSVSAVAACVACLLAVDPTHSFTAPLSSVSSRVFTPAGNVKYFSPAVSNARSALSMAADVVATPEEPPKEKLLEGLGVGILRDYKARLPMYGSDVKDGLNVQVSIYKNDVNIVGIENGIQGISPSLNLDSALLPPCFFFLRVWRLPLDLEAFLP
jgi:hypothetical protein